MSAVRIIPGARRDQLVDNIRPVVEYRGPVTIATVGAGEYVEVAVISDPFDSQTIQYIPLDAFLAAARGFAIAHDRRHE